MFQISELKDKCASNLELVQELLAEVDQCQNDVKELNSVYNHVSHQTNALHTSCERLLEEESQLLSGVAMISEKLNYFNEYDKIMQKLHSPIFSAKSGSFTNLLQRIEECIEYLESNPHYKVFIFGCLLNSKTWIFVAVLGERKLPHALSKCSFEGRGDDQKSFPVSS